MKFIENFLPKKEKPIVLDSKIDRIYNTEIIEKYFSNYYSIPNTYITAYEHWTSRDWLDLPYSKSIKEETEDLNDFDYYSTLKKYFEIDFKNFLVFIKDKYKPWTKCFVDKKSKGEIDLLYNTKSEYIQIPWLTIKWIHDGWYTIKTESGRWDYFRFDWIIWEVNDSEYDKLINTFNVTSKQDLNSEIEKKEKPPIIYI